MTDRILNFIDKHPGWTFAGIVVVTVLLFWAVWIGVVWFAWNVLAVHAFGAESLSFLQIFAVAFFLNLISSIFRPRPSTGNQ